MKKSSALGIAALLSGSALMFGASAVMAEPNVDFSITLSSGGLPAVDYRAPVVVEQRVVEYRAPRYHHEQVRYVEHHVYHGNRYWRDHERDDGGHHDGWNHGRHNG